MRRPSHLSLETNLMKKLAILGAVLLSAACTDLPTAALSAEDALRSNGAAESKIDVAAIATVQVGGTGFYRESGPGANSAREMGTCVSGGRWYNPQTKKTSAGPHPLCWTAGSGRTLTVTFLEIATYVQARSGNVQLNFGSDAAGAERRIHFQAQKDATNGLGVIVGSDDEGGSWTIDFAQPLLNNSTNLIDRAGTDVMACNAAHGCHPATMTW